MVKTVSSAEARTLKKMLPDYHDHVSKKYPVRVQGDPVGSDLDLIPISEHAADAVLRPVRAEARVADARQSQDPLCRHGECALLSPAVSAAPHRP